MIIPALLVLTDRTQCVGPLVDTIAAVVDGGAWAVVLREKDLPEEERDRLAAELWQLLEPVGGALIRAGRPVRRDTAALHLAAADPFPEPRPALVGRSCHSVEELCRARAEGCDYALLSPVFPTDSKPGYGPSLGLDGLAAMIPAGPPVYALGGIRPADAAGCVAVGARGVAVMGALMREPGLVAAYLDALGDPAA